VPGLTLQVLPGRLSLCRLELGTPIPPPADGAPLWAALRSAGELSVLVPEGGEPAGARVERGWRALRVAEPHDLDGSGVTVGILEPLARARVGVVVVGSFDTDHVLVREERLAEAVAVLVAADFAVEDAGAVI